ncbi:MAG: hypothetical protein ACE5ID_04980 [Acidobacteriota bacterium]
MPNTIVLNQGQGQILTLPHEQTESRPQEPRATTPAVSSPLCLPFEPPVGEQDEEIDAQRQPAALPPALGDKGPAGASRPGVACCPACGEELKNRPLVRQICPHCGGAIHVRARQSLYPNGLVAEENLNAIDFLEAVEPLGISEAVVMRRLKSAPVRGAKPPSLGDIVLTLCREQAETLPPHRRARLFNEMSLFLKWEGRPFLERRRQAELCQLQALRQEGVRRVQLATRRGSACAACQAAAGLVLEIDAAEREQCLPVAGCRHPEGWCRCLYRPAPLDS